MPMLITNGTSIDYDIQGKGPPLLLISGLGFGRWGWFKQIPMLSRHFRTITFDVRSVGSVTGGVGDLTSNAVALLEQLDIKKTHVLGTSLGGFVAQKLALERPDLVDRLVLVCTSYGGRGPQPMSPQVLGRMFGLGSLSPESAVRRGLETAASAAYRSAYLEEFEQVVRWRLADSPSLPHFYKEAMAGARFDASREVRNITSPTLVIHGADDCYVPVANARALAKAIPSAKLHVLERAAHLVFIEQAEEVNKHVVSFLKPRKPRRRQKPKELPASHKTLSLFKPRKRWSQKKVPAEQRPMRLLEWLEEFMKEITFSLKPLKPQRRPRVQGGSVKPNKSALRLRAARKAASSWEKRLRSWLSLSP